MLVKTGFSVEINGVHRYKMLKKIIIKHKNWQDIQEFFMKTAKNKHTP